MRLIDADELADRLIKMWVYALQDNDLFCQGETNALVGAIRAVNEAPTVGEWISVKDKLPEDQSPVLVYVPPYIDEDEEYLVHVSMAYYTYTVRGGFWAGTDGNVYGAIGIIHEPSHWMHWPRPEPPVE